jgi:hypothetical protein
MKRRRLGIREQSTIQGVVVEAQAGMEGEKGGVAKEEVADQAEDQTEEAVVLEEMTGFQPSCAWDR